LSSQVHEPVCRTSDILVAFPQPRCGSLLRTDSAKLPKIVFFVCFVTAHVFHNPGCLPSIGNRRRLFCCDPLSSPQLCHRDPTEPRCFAIAVFASTFALPFGHDSLDPRPRKQLPPFGKTSRLRFSGPQHRLSTSATHSDARAHPTNVSSSPARESHAWFLRYCARYVWAERLEIRIRKRVPLLVIARALESPTPRVSGAGGFPNGEKRPKTSVWCHPAKSDTFREIEVLSVDPIVRARREAHAPMRIQTMFPFTPPSLACLGTRVICRHCSRKQRLYIHLRGASS